MGFDHTRMILQVADAAALRHLVADAAHTVFTGFGSMPSGVSSRAQVAVARAGAVQEHVPILPSVQPGT